MNPVYMWTPKHLYTCAVVQSCTPIHLYTCTPIHWYTYTHLHPYICTPIHPYMYTPTHLYTHTLVHLYICTPVQLYIPVHPYTCAQPGIGGKSPPVTEPQFITGNRFRLWLIIAIRYLPDTRNNRH